MNKEQVYKLLKITIIATAFMTFFEAIFAIPGVSEWISEYIHSINNKWLLWLTIWMIMFIQVCIIPIPAYIVLNAAVNIGLVSKEAGIINTISSSNFWIFIAVSISAYMAGALIAYAFGYRYGRKALMWCAGSEEEYDKWSEFLGHKGKWAYAATVFLPLFPDDLLCLVAGSIKIDVWFFFFSNLIGRTVGLITMLLVLVVFNHVTDGAIPWSFIVWSIILIALIIVYKKIQKDLRKEKEETENK